MATMMQPDEKPEVATPADPDSATENEQTEAKGGPVDVDSIIAKIQVDPKFKSIYDKAVISGMRIMFSKDSHQMLLDQLQKPGELPQKIAEGITTLVYMLWTQSNQTLPPQIIAPVTVTLTLKAFDFLQKSGDPDASAEDLGEAMDATIDMVMGKFGVQRNQIEQMMGQGQQQGPSLMQQARQAQQPAPTQQQGAMQ